MQIKVQKMFLQTFIIIAAYAVLLSYFYFTQEGRSAFANNQILASLLLVAGALFYPIAIKMSLAKAFKVVTYILLGFFILEFVLKFYFLLQIFLILGDSIFIENFISALVYLMLAFLMFLMLKINKFIN